MLFPCAVVLPLKFSLCSKKAEGMRFVPLRSFAFSTACDVKLQSCESK